VERNVEPGFIFFHQHVNGFELRRFPLGANLGIIMNSLFSKFVGTTLFLGFLACLAALTPSHQIYANPAQWDWEWPKTDFTKKSVDFGEILSGGVPKDGIRSIDNPEFMDIKEAKSLPRTMPLLSFELNGEAKAYPLGILTRAEIVNDRVGGVPVTVTYCPLCNSAIVFDARVDGERHEFGVSGKLRNSDMIMYDRTTESWWQQFQGEAIVGKYTGKLLKMLPSRLESVEKFTERFPNGKILHVRGRVFNYNPYGGYDSSSVPFLYQGELPKNIGALKRVIAIGDEAWSLDLLRQKKRIEKDDLVLTWSPGQNSAMDTPDISQGKDVGNVVVQRKTDRGLMDEVHDVTFAFVFHAFRPNGTLHHTK